MFNKEKLNELILDRKISQQELAEKVGVTQAFISYILRGFKEPSLEVAYRLAMFFDVTIESLIKIK